jgi:hypothetical protein
MDITIEGLQAVEADFAAFPLRSGRAMVRALNRAINSGRTVMVRAIAKDMGLKSTDVRNALRLAEASLAKPEARLAASLKQIPLIKFNARGPEPSRGKGRGVSYRLPGGRGRIPSGFIATMRSGHRGVFTRKGSGRLPIEEKFGPSIGHVFRKYRPQGLARAKEAFAKNFAHEMEFARSRGGAD